MPPVAEPVVTSLKSLVESRAGLAGLGTAVLYVLGYIVVRFRLQALGLVDVELSIVDERYIFAGFWFCLYLAMSACNLVFLLIPFIIAGLWLRDHMPPGPGGRLRQWFRRPDTRAAMAFVFSLLVVQMVLRRCFDAGNLLYADRLPDSAPWVNAVLDDPGGRLAKYYLSIVLLSCIPPAWLLWRLRYKTFARHGWLILSARTMLALQLFFLPATFGWLLADRQLPRILAVEGKPVPQNEQAWLLWQDRSIVVYLRRDSTARSIVQMPRERAGTLELGPPVALLRALELEGRRP